LNVNHGQVIFRCFFENRWIEDARVDQVVQVKVVKKSLKEKEDSVELGTVEISVEDRVSGMIKPIVGAPSWKSLVEMNQQGENVEFRNRVAICSCCIWEFIPLQVIEFVEFHLNVGFRPIFIGVYEMPGLVEKYELLLSDYIQRGLVSVSRTQIDGLVFTNKFQVFYNNQCFYYTKSLSKWTAIWDVDEFFYFTGDFRKREGHSIFLVQDILNNLIKNFPFHDDVCYFSMQSAHVLHNERYPAQNSREDLNIERFRYRSVELNDISTKTIVNTQLTFAVAIHGHFSCSAQNRPLKDPIHVDSKYVIGRSFPMMKNVFMFHFVNLFALRIDGSSFQTVPSEYTRDHEQDVRGWVGAAIMRSNFHNQNISFCGLTEMKRLCN
jgi:hypothetical protein